MNNLKTLLLNLLLLLPAASAAQPASAVAERVIDHWLSMHNQFKDTADVWGNYTLDLTLEAMLLYGQHTQQKKYLEIVTEVFQKRGITPADTIPHRGQPFCSINFLLGQRTNNTDWHKGYIGESYEMIWNGEQSTEGAITHQAPYKILIDYLQEYASRLARTGYLTGDERLYAEAVEQFVIYEALLRDPTSGLWCQGRGWCPEDTTKLAEGAWSRGHGWLLRGLVSSLQYLPKSNQKELLPILERVAASLLKVQSESGMYHILLDLPVEDSAPDISGTGMIAYYLAVAVQQGWLVEAAYRPSILKATKAMREYLSASGEVLSSSKGPGPLCNRKEYIGYQPAIDEKHGFQGAIYGMLAEVLLGG